MQMDPENTFSKQASRMHENRRAAGLPSSIPYCMRVMDPGYELTENQVATFIKTLNKF